LYNTERSLCNIERRLKSIHALWATSARSFSIQKYISVMSLCFLLCGAAYIDIDGLVCCQEPFFFFFSFLSVPMKILALPFFLLIFQLQFLFFIFYFLLLALL